MKRSYYESYVRAWDMAERVVPVSYSGSLGDGVAGGYVTAPEVERREIFIVRPELDGKRRPTQILSDWEIRDDLFILVHELGHATNHINGGVRYERFRLANTLWLLMGMDGRYLNETERNVILEEETLAEEFGKQTIQDLVPEWVADYDRRIADNLSCYTALLWTGAWPDGRPASRGLKHSFVNWTDGAAGR